uniref:Uncharacterized protein n=1 Tax=Romanomermis culicivorax TaxID=13658 RepID=A0A915JIS4_ROMCU
MTQGLGFITIRGTNGASASSGYKMMTTLPSSNPTTNQISTGSPKSILAVTLTNASLTSTTRPQSATVVVGGLATSDDELIIDYTMPDSISQQMETTTGDNMDYAQLTSAVTTSTALGIQGMTEDIDNEYTTLELFAVKVDPIITK